MRNLAMTRVTELHRPCLSHAHLKLDQALEIAIDFCSNKLRLS